MTSWTVPQIALQSGRSFLITGVGGLGYHAALEIGRAGGQVILTGRNAERGAEAVSAIRAEVPAADIRFEPLDLADLASIRSLGARMRSRYDSLDVLINNAGVMNLSIRRETADGLELMFGTNHLGHFVLSDALLPLLRKGTDLLAAFVYSAGHGSARSYTVPNGRFL
jgi:NAD(P)-dependent dehydrogenase (short-subunit alcohol dehydrogenase family)